MMKKLRFWNKSLMARLVSTFFFLLLITVSLVGYMVYQQATRSLTQSVFDRLHAVATLKEDGLNRWVDQQRLNLVFIAWQPEIRRQAGMLLNDSSSPADRQAAYSTLSDYLKFVVTSVSDSDEMFILDMNGRIILSTQPAHEGQSQAQAPYFLQGRSTTYVQPVYTSPDSKRPTITVSTPLFDQNKRRVGVLAGHLNLSRIDRIILERTGLGSSGETYLVNPAHEFVSAALFATPDMKGGSARSKGIDAALQGKTGADLYTNYEGIPVIGVYTWLNDRGVALMAEMSQDEAFAPARQLAWTIVAIGLLCTLVLVVVAYLISRRIARPILAITHTAARVASGDLTQTAPVMTDDEVGLLARTFNEMTAQLRILYEGLEKKVAERTARLQEEIVEREVAQEKLRHQNEYLAALHNTTVGLISHLELQDLLEDLVTRAGQLSRTPHGFMYIVEPDASEIICKVGVGMFTQLVGFHLPKGEGLGGTIWDTGEPLVINDYDEWAGRAKSLDKNLIRSIIGIPLKSGAQVIGVLGVAYSCQDEETRTFGENEVELLSRFAQLASIALENARLYTGAKEAREAAEEANASKSAFLANVSHELRTPLTSILGFARIVQKRLQDRVFPIIPLSDPKVEKAVVQVDENLKIILSEGDRLTSLINDLLDLEKIRAGKMVWHMEALQISDVIDRAAAATSSLFESKGLEWVRDVPRGLPQVYGDRDRLVQVIINLISNAVKFTSQGTVTCQARQEAGAIMVSVIDQGIGIAKEDQALVFEKFKQVGDTLTNKPKGTGLGLAICKEIIEYHGGRIWLQSEPGVGSTFTFSLPIHQAQSPAEPASLPAEESEEKVVDVHTLLTELKPHLTAVPVAHNDGPKTILVVDDDASIRKLLRQELESEQYNVLEAANGVEALEQVKQARPDLMILDVLMPEMNGFDVAAVLKTNPNTRDLPIVIISILHDQERGYHVGVDGYFTKPIDISALLAEVQTLLSQGYATKKVLVVDEDVPTVQLLCEALLAQGYQVNTAYTGREGLEKALSDRPDMVIANAELSEKHQLVQVLRFEKKLKNIIFLLFQ